MQALETHKLGFKARFQNYETYRGKTRLRTGKFRLVEDSTGCRHRFIVGPQKIENSILFGSCDHCKIEVAIELEKDSQTERTGRSWLVQFEKGVESEL